jgi:hypothetical protein
VIEGLTPAQLHKMCDAATRHMRRSVSLTMSGGVIMVTNVALILALHSLWQSWALIPVSAIFFIWGEREGQRAKEIMDMLNAQIRDLYRRE